VSSAIKQACLEAEGLLGPLTIEISAYSMNNTNKQTNSYIVLIIGGGIKIKLIFELLGYRIKYSSVLYSFEYKFTNCGVI
jgi:hypothetical protein